MQALTVCLSYFMESKLDILCFSDILNLWKVNFTYRRERRLKNKLEELRKQRGIKQEDLANALAVSRLTIGSLENGRYNPSIILAFKIARYFGVRIEDIFIFEEDEDE